LKPDFIEFIQNARERRTANFRNQLSIFLVCLGISVFLWILVRLSKDYYYTVEYNLKYVQVPENLRLVYNSDKTLMLKMKVQGFDFFSERYFKPRDKNIEVSLRGIKVKYNGHNLSGFLLTQNIGRDIALQYSSPQDFFSATPDTLFFEFERVSLRKIPIQKSLQGSGSLEMHSVDSALLRDSIIHARMKEGIHMPKLEKYSKPSKK
jgi:hypothetical protein